MSRSWTVLEKYDPKPSKAVFSRVFHYNFRHEAVNDVISGLAMHNVRVDVFVKFGDFMSNRFRDIRGAVFASNEWTWRSLYFPHPNETVSKMSVPICNQTVRDSVNRQHLRTHWPIGPRTMRPLCLNPQIGDQIYQKTIHYPVSDGYPQGPQ